jgi:hypothetical protein
MEQRAVEMGLPVTSATAIIEYVTDYVQRVAGAS